MIFSPLPRLSLASILALALLVTLGVWQLRRADEKRSMIAAYEAAAAQPPAADLEAAFCATAGGAPASSALMPSDVFGDELRFYGARADGAPGWRLLRLAPAPSCLGTRTALVVEAGFETLGGDRSGPPEAVRIVPPPAPGAFTPKNAPERGEFYRFDPAAFARALGVSPDTIAAQWWLAPRNRGLPPGLADMPPSRHVGYAVTWFGLALGLVAVYLAFHARAGRLRLGA